LVGLKSGLLVGLGFCKKTPKIFGTQVRSAPPMYESFLRTSHQLLVPGGQIVCVFPTVNDRSLLGRFVDSIPRFGYHALDSVRVERPGQFISRTIGILEKHDGA